MTFFENLKRRIFGPVAVASAPAAPGVRFLLAPPSPGAADLITRLLPHEPKLGTATLVDARRIRNRVGVLRRGDENDTVRLWADLFVVSSESVFPMGSTGYRWPTEASGDPADALRAASQAAFDGMLSYPARAAAYVPVAARPPALWVECEPLSLQCITDRFDHTPEAEVDAVEARLGLQFPRGYREFVTRYGSSVISNFVRIHPPEQILELLPRERATQEAFDLYPGDATLDFEDLLSIVPIGSTTHGDVLAVTPHHRDRMYVLPRNARGIHCIDGPLDALLRFVLREPFCAAVDHPLIVPTRPPSSRHFGASPEAYSLRQETVVDAVASVVPADAQLVRTEDEDGPNAWFRIPSLEAEIWIHDDEPPTVEYRTYSPAWERTIAPVVRALAKLGLR